MEEKHLSSAGNYTDESIKTMEGIKYIRLWPGMYIGGCTYCVVWSQNRHKMIDNQP